MKLRPSHLLMNHFFCKRQFRKPAKNLMALTVILALNFDCRFSMHERNAFTHQISFPELAY